MTIAPVVSRRGSCLGQRLVIVAPGPSYDETPREVWDNENIFVLNFAMTEFKEVKNCWWLCHDFWHCWPRYGMPKRMEGYDWKLITRRVYLPGPVGNVSWRDVCNSTVKRRFPWHIKRVPRTATVLWYSDLECQDGYVRNGNTVLELALEIATIWGFKDVVIVGADMQKVKGKFYGTPWNDWKPCKIKKEKFVEMKKSINCNRKRWPDKTYNLSPYWDSPFINISPEDYLKEIKK